MAGQPAGYGAVIGMIRIDYDGQVITGGQLFRDNRKVNVRTLRVDDADDRGYVQLAVILQDGQRPSQPDRGTVVSVDRLLSKAFVRVEQQAGR
jgi:hypothetical protein